MSSFIKTVLHVTLVSLSLAACSGSGVTEADISALEASMKACTEGTESPNKDQNFAESMESVGNALNCATEIYDAFFFERCGEEEAFSGIMAATMKKAISAGFSSNEESGELTSEEVQELVGECAADLWQAIEAMDSKT